MKKSADISLPFKPIAHFFQRFHLTIFIVVVVGGLAYAVTSLYGVLSDASTIPTSTATSSTSFDQTTIDRLNQLHTSNSAPADVQLPAGRINPVNE